MAIFYEGKRFYSKKANPLCYEISFSTDRILVQKEEYGLFNKPAGILRNFSGLLGLQGESLFTLRGNGPVNRVIIG